MLKPLFPAKSDPISMSSDGKYPAAPKKSKMIQTEMSMKKVITSAVVAIALIGSAVSASATTVPAKDASLKENLSFWSQFADND